MQHLYSSLTLIRCLLLELKNKNMGNIQGIEEQTNDNYMNYERINNSTNDK